MALSAWARSLRRAAPWFLLATASVRGAEAAHVWNQRALILPQQTQSKLLTFGNALSVSGDTALLAASGDFSSGSGPPLGNVGGAYVFVRTGSAWVQQGPVLFAPRRNADGFDQFGTSLALSGDTALIGDPETRDLDGTGQGVANVFVRSSGGAWFPSGAPLHAPNTTSFGSRVALSGDTALVTAQDQSTPKAARGGFVFALENGVWSQQGPALETEGAVNFGSAIAVSADTALISANPSPSVVYVFERGAPAWTANGTLAASPGSAATAEFGASLALSGDTAVVGAPDSTNPGRVYVFARRDGSWVPEATLAAPDGSPGNQFGAAVSLSDDVLAVVAPQQVNNGQQQGAVYVFERSSSNWVTPLGPAIQTQPPYYYAGSALSVSGTTVLVGLGFGPNGASIFDDQCASYAECSAGSSCEDGACLAGCALDSDCVDGSHCVPSGKCQPKAADGAACDAPSACSSGNCVDGVCCDTPCAGQCQACAEPGSPGTCSPVMGAPRGNRDACAGDPAVCGGTCDGSQVDACSYRSPKFVCEQACKDGTATVATCNEDHRCGTPASTACGLYTCGDEVCLSSCVSDADCSAGNACGGGRCAPPEHARCTADLSAALPADDSEPISCLAYTCDSARGACRTACQASTDCAPGYGCDPNGLCLPLPRPTDGTSSGCGCHVAARPAAGGSVAGALFLLALAFLRRASAAARGRPRNADRELGSRTRRRRLRRGATWRATITQAAATSSIRRC